jgi:endoribonuclease Dicer
MVGYLQSRGRARRFDSTYIVMIPEGSSEEHTRYNELRQSEPEIKRMYQAPRDSEESEMEVDEPDDPMDLAARLHYHIHSTGALLTFSSAISLLSNLCALIPRDKYTPVLQPQFYGDFQMSVVLPSALPIPRECLVHNGSIRRTKREAKAAAAFAACKALHELKVFDDYLLPARKTSGADIEDADGRPIPEVGKVSEMMDVAVCDPWSPWHCPWSGEVLNSHAWVYPLFFMDQAEAMIGLVTAINLGSMPPLTCKDNLIRFGTPTRIGYLSESQLNVLQDYTKIGINWYNTAKRVKNPLAGMLALLTSDGSLDVNSMRLAIQTPTRSNGIMREDEGHLILRCQLEFGRPLLLRRLREDLTPLSRIILSDDLAPVGEYATYADVYERQNKHRKYPLELPRDGPLLQVRTYHIVFLHIG